MARGGLKSLIPAINRDTPDSRRFCKAQAASRTSGSSNVREINAIRQNQVETEPSDPDMLSLRLLTRITFLTETKIKRNLWLPPNAFDSSLYIKEHQVFLKAVT